MRVTDWTLLWPACVAELHEFKNANKIKLIEKLKGQRFPGIFYELAV